MCPHSAPVLGQDKGLALRKKLQSLLNWNNRHISYFEKNSISAFKVRFGSILKFSSVRFNSTRQLSLERCFGDPHYSGWVTQETRPEMVSREMSKKFYEAHLFVNTSFTESYRFHAHIYHPTGSFFPEFFSIHLQVGHIWHWALIWAIQQDVWRDSSFHVQLANQPF